jgi:hypothetical protein
VILSSGTSRRRKKGAKWGHRQGGPRPISDFFGYFSAMHRGSTRRILYSARGRALAGSARERSDMGCGPLALDPSVFVFYFVILSGFLFPVHWFGGFFSGFSCSKQFRIWTNSKSEFFSKFTYFFGLEYIWIFNKIQTWTNLNFEQISDLNKFEFWTNFRLEQICIWTNSNFRIWKISDLNKFWIWTIFRFEQISDLKNFSDLNNFRICFFVQIWTNSEN